MKAILKPKFDNDRGSDTFCLERKVATDLLCVQLGVDELASGDWREGGVLFPL
jgi:hypothetical protein